MPAPTKLGGHDERILILPRTASGIASATWESAGLVSGGLVVRGNVCEYADAARADGGAALDVDDDAADAAAACAASAIVAGISPEPCEPCEPATRLCPHRT